MEAVIGEGKARCPKCGALLCKIYFGAKVTGVELWCRGCKAPVMLNIS